MSHQLESFFFDMDDSLGQRIVAHTSQLLIQHGIRAVRMNDVAKQMNISKRTIYLIYPTKDKLINICIDNYLERLKKQYNTADHYRENILEQLNNISKAYIADLYKADSVFWFDINQNHDYQYGYGSFSREWRNKLE